MILFFFFWNQTFELILMNGERHAINEPIQSGEILIFSEHGIRFSIPMALVKSLNQHEPELENEGPERQSKSITFIIKAPPKPIIVTDEILSAYAKSHPFEVSDALTVQYQASNQAVDQLEDLEKLNLTFEKQAQPLRDKLALAKTAIKAKKRELARAFLWERRAELMHELKDLEGSLGELRSKMDVLIEKHRKAGAKTHASSQ